ncbi:chemotaxis protein CheW [Haloimpatiens sp. FM7315]|uniref:chemotaxis protein CheW n=1 Tax=Haloimpatiens sp. FM7315 TaxID=3298609 RepID=UPI0035A320AF
MTSSELKVLIFSVNDEHYAANIMDIERILGYKEPTELPDSPDFVEGVIDYEGKVLPIISLAKKFNLPSREKSNECKIIVAKSGSEKIGIIVDVVLEVKDIRNEDVENTPGIASTLAKRYIKGLIKLKGEIIIYLNLLKILTEEEKEDIIK